MTKTYLEMAREDGLSDEGIDLLRTLAAEAKGDPDADELYDITNYSLCGGEWDQEVLPVVAAMNWAADRTARHQVAALLALREAFGLLPLV